MKILSLDLETFSDIDLRKCGVYRYTNSPNFDILLFAYSIDEESVELIDLASGEEIPEKLMDAILSKEIIKTAFNANFERVALMRYLSRILGRVVYLDPSSWICSMSQAVLLGLPLSLESVGRVLRLGEQKITEGKALIRYFCIPCKPTAANGGRIRNLPSDAPEKWELFKKYNIRDVEVELAIREKLSAYQISDNEQEIYVLDQKINDRGLEVDMALVDEAISCNRQFTVAATERAYELTRLENPNSVSQLKVWLSDRGVEVESLSKKAVTELVDETEGEVEEALKLRLLMAKTSVKKYEAIERAVCSDGRVHGLFQYYGANRTGRWSGRLCQFQNLPQNHLKDLELARDLVKEGRFEDVELLFGNTPNVLSELIRTAFVPKENHRFIVSDFSAIEARVISWLAKEKWRLEVFASHGKIYEAAAARIFNVPVEKVTKSSPLRQRGKISELACIAEGELVLTNNGLVPIEDVTLEHRLWDGDEWVTHDGVIYKGEKEVMEYEGLRATEDHLVWVKGQPKPIHFGKAASSGSYLVQTGNSWKAIRMDKNYKSRDKIRNEVLSKSANTMYRMSFDTVVKSIGFNEWKIKRMPRLFSTCKRKRVNSRNIVAQVKWSQKQMREPIESKLQKLWKKRNTIQIQKCNNCWIMGYKQYRNACRRIGTRQNRHQWQLRNRKSEVGDEIRKCKQPATNTSYPMETRNVALWKTSSATQNINWYDKRRNYCRGRGCCEIAKKSLLETYRSKVRVYDIQNAGRHHRYTVSGKLVHNCGYGGGVGALKAMGALEMGVEEHELQGLIDNWRAANPHIVKLWWDVDKAAITAVKERTRTSTHGINFTYISGMLFVTLPSGRNLVYVKPKLGLNKFGREGLTYEGIGTTKKWERIETYGPKIVENIVQAIARDILAESMLRLDKAGFKIVAHVHDEVICEVPNGVSSVEEVCTIMSKSVSWASGLPLRADGYECDFYKKD